MKPALQSFVLWNLTAIYRPRIYGVLDVALSHVEETATDMLSVHYKHLHYGGRYMCQEMKVNTYNRVNG